jgi:hypothetical protein
MSQEPDEIQFSESGPSLSAAWEAGEHEPPVETEKGAQPALINDLEARIREIEVNSDSDEAFVAGLITLIESILASECDLDTEFQFSKCAKALKLGIIANRIYPVVTRTMKWGPWVTEHFRGVSASMVKYCRDMASRPDCHIYFRWGIKRVVRLISTHS